MNMKKSHTNQGYWKSLNELSGLPEFTGGKGTEIPGSAAEPASTVSRRGFLGLLGASISLAGFAGCRKPVEKIIPYVIQPEEVVPGIPLYYATTMPAGSHAYGLVVESHEGRPTKIEGNEQHPSTLGASNAQIQASILSLYDPDRSREILNKNTSSSWDAFAKFWKAERESYLITRGKGLGILLEPFASPSLKKYADLCRERFPEAKIAVWEPVNNENIFPAKKEYRQEYLFDKADVIVSLDADFLLTDPEAVVNNRRFAAGRNVTSVHDTMNRLYVAESAYSVTGAMADHRIRVNSGNIGTFAAALANELISQGLDIKFGCSADIPGAAGFDHAILSALAKDLLKSAGKSIVLAGKNQPPAVHTLIFQINRALGNCGKTILYRKLSYTEESDIDGLTKLLNAMHNGSVQTLIVLGGNPAYTAPMEYDFTELMKKIPVTVHLSLHKNETSEHASWHIPVSHYLESWGDAQATDGTLSVIQPLIRPMYKSVSLTEMLQFIATGNFIKGYDIVRSEWQQLTASDFEKTWKKVLQDGLLSGSAVAPEMPPVKDSEITSLLQNNKFSFNKYDTGGLELNLHESSAVYDGRYANTGWLQECPDPVTKITWDNPALMSRHTAESLNLRNGEMAVFTAEERKIELPVWIVPGMADFTVAVTLGYGRKKAGAVGTGVGFNVYPIRGLNEQWTLKNVSCSGTGNQYPVACTQDHSSMEGRPLILEATLEEYRHHPEFAQHAIDHPPLRSPWKEHSYETGYQWGMIIDLNKCTGCNTCVIACQSENNIPIIGKVEVEKGREMHWIRIDRYFNGNGEDPEMVFQPMTCQQCELAPCEQVCPVAATVHDKEGLNNMVYNRCVGTRYCSNNCPFKVRRFNFFNYTARLKGPEKMAQNPDVTIRSRGVMEKCSYCVQRISRARITAKNERRKITEGEVKTACQQSCPAGAISFGNMKDPSNRLKELKKNDRNYEMLSELNLKARTSYYAKLRNPNPEIKGHG